MTEFTATPTQRYSSTLLIQGQHWWWYVIAGGILIACLTSPSAIVRQIVLPIAWVWPLLIWSAVGNREIHNNVQQMTFSSALPLMRQLPAQWLAGFVFTRLISLGALPWMAIPLAFWRCSQA